MITRPQGSDDVYVLRVDYAPMRAAIQRAREGTAEPMPLLRALAQYTRLADYSEEIPLDEPGAFTLIRLGTPKQRFRERLNDVHEVENYLRSAVPLEFHPAFPHADAIREGLRKQGVPLRLISVSLKPSTARKPVELYQANVPNLLRPIIKPIRDGNRLVAVVWLCVNRERKVIKPEKGTHPEAVAGFQTRFKSFGIGDRRLLQRFWPGVGSGVVYRHVTGEVHVLDPTLTPSAERGNFEDTRSRETLFNLLKTAFTELNEPIVDRRDALSDIENGNKEGDLARVDQGFENIEIVRQSFPVRPPLTLEEILDTPGLKIAREREEARAKAAAEAEAAGDGESDSESDGESDGTQEGAGDSGAGGDDGEGGGDTDESDGESGGEDGADDQGDDDEPIPTIAEILLDLNIDWPSEAQEIFESIDNALIEVVERRNVEACRSMLKAMLQRRYNYLGDAD